MNVRKIKRVLGATIIVVLCYHLFVGVDKYEWFTSRYRFSNIPFVSYIFIPFQAYPSVILMLLGSYFALKGNNLKTDKLLKQQFKFTKKLLVTISIIFVAMAILGLFPFSRPLTIVYQTSNIFKVAMLSVFDIFGLNSSLGFPTINSSWYLTRIILFCTLLFVVIYKDMKKTGIIVPLLYTIILVMLPQSKNIAYYIMSFLWGIALINSKQLKAVMIYLKSNKTINILFFIICYLAMFNLNFFIQPIFAFSFIMIFAFLFGEDTKINWVNSSFEYIGNFAIPMYYLHTFVYGIYLKDFIYWWKYPLLIFIVSFVITFIGAVLIYDANGNVRWSKKSFGTNVYTVPK